MNWLLGIIVVGVLLIAGCAVMFQVATKSAKDTIDHAAQSTCYQAGWFDGEMQTRHTPPSGDSQCAALYANGLADAISGKFNPPSD